MTYPHLKDVAEVRTVIRQSEKLKTDGNDAFSRREYDACVELYTSALRLIDSTCNNKFKSILYSNRAAARMQQLQYVPAWSFACVCESEREREFVCESVVVDARVLMHGDVAVWMSDVRACVCVPGRYRLATADCSSALRMDSMNLKARLRRARCNVELGQFDSVC
jgi:hypothetical protein